MKRTQGIIRKLSLVGLMSLTLVGCAPRVAHKGMSEDQVGLAALHEDALKQTVYGNKIQGYVGQYAIFADVVNQEVLRDLSGFVEKYNVYAKEPIQYTETGIQEVDPFFLRAAKAVATVRVGTRLMNYIGCRLKAIDDPDSVSRNTKDIYFTMTPEEVSEAVRSVRNKKGMLSSSQKREVARDVIALVAGAGAVEEAANLAKGMLPEGQNLQTMVNSTSFRNELQARDSKRAELLPEIKSNLNGTLAGLRQAAIDGDAITRNSQMWQLLLADSMD